MPRPPKATTTNNNTNNTNRETNNDTEPSATPGQVRTDVDNNPVRILVSIDNRDFELDALQPISELSDSFTPEDGHEPGPTYYQIFIPTLAAAATVKMNEAVDQRRKKALKLGADGLGIPRLLTCHSLSRRAYRNSTLKAYLETLEAFLSTIKTVRTKPGDVNSTMYAASGSLFEEYSLELRELLGAIDKSLKIKGRQAPEVPSWPAGSVGVDFFSLNDLEIFLLAYRVQVEEFLYQIDQVHDFEKGDVRTRDGRTGSPGRNLIDPGSISAVLRQARAQRYAPETGDKTTSQRENPFPKATRISELWGNGNREKPPHLDEQHTKNREDDGDDPSDPDSSDNDEGRSGPRRNGRGKGRGRERESKKSESKENEVRFDLKLKYDAVPSWDGDSDTIVKWLENTRYSETFINLKLSCQIVFYKSD
ncbi:hypothetical protein K435DRAFT_850985 [Dendrothele bispora CBS 962.96]|uniref:Uncharacterized protein n=1 Tax=Dendrothele bispora (strain CBS 962.96) TaxID=1314807 RepID=A0A4S8MN42_DENBC|nr:hypothetical protein K435DRAFT_850985 [Dendrothele bispora CBS 962.96]